jgi:ribosomal protein S8
MLSKSVDTAKFKVTNIKDLEILYSVLRETYPKNEIEILFNWNTKEYNVYVKDKPYQQDPEVPIDLNIQVVYGDSVTGDTPLLLKKSGLVYIETIKSIFNIEKKQEYPGFKMFDKTIRLEKEFSTTDYQIWTDIGWVDIKRVIRHKCDKKIYKILTHTGYVKVTEDHSLIKEDLEIVKPKECDLETKLLNSYPSTFNESCNIISKDRAFIYGFFYGDGSCNKYNCKSGLKYTWALNNSDMDILNNLKNLLQKEYPDSVPVIYDTLESSGVYKLTINNPKNIVLEFRDKFYDSDKLKKIPTEILNSNNEIVQSFFNGYWAADGCRKDKEKIGCTRFDNKGDIGSAGLYYLMKKLGYNVSLNTRSDKEKILRLTITEKSQRKISNQIKRIENIDHNDYVYDIETSIGRFSAGVGDIIISNTDSVFLRFKYNRDDFELNRRDTFRLATNCGDNLTENIFNRKPIELEFEKVFHPFVLLTKKRYIANKYENPKDPFQLKCVDAKGIALTRRDYCPMVKKCYKQIIDTILNDKTSTGEQINQSVDSVKRSTELYRGFIDAIYNYKIEIDDLVVSAMLASSYKTRPVHVQLAERLKERKEEVQIGDRIPYIYIETNDPKQAKSELGEDPQYAIKHNLKFNRSCYLEQLAKPILGFYKIVLKDREDLLDEIINYTNTTLVKCGGKALKPSDFKIED